MAAILFSEDFQTRIDPNTQLPVSRCTGGGGPGTYPFPNGWLLRNVDNRNPTPDVAYINEAWEVREDFQLDASNCAAFSTSWYTPGARADDWMWTPPIGPIPPAGATLSWRGRAMDPDYPDGYEVRVMAVPNAPTGGTGVIGNQVTNSTVVFSTAAEASSWASHTVDLGAYQGQSVYIGFRNNTLDKFVLLLDDIMVVSVNDLAAQAAPGFAVAYSRVPQGISVSADYKVVAANIGASTFTNVGASAQLTLGGSAQGAPVMSGNVPSLATGASATLSFGAPVVLSAAGTWGVTYTLSANEVGNDSNLGNNVLQVAATTIGGTEWARHEGAPFSTLGIASGTGGELGNTFTLTQTASFEGVRFGMGPVDAASGWPGHNVVANLRSTDPTGKPDALIATTTAITSSLIGGVYEVTFVGGPQTLAPGTYFVGVVQPTGLLDAMPLQVNLQRFAPRSHWVTLDTPPDVWEPLEAFGSDYEVVPNVSLLTGVSLFKDDFELHGGPPAAWAAVRPASTTPAMTRRSRASTALSIPQR